MTAFRTVFGKYIYINHVQYKRLSGAWPILVISPLSNKIRAPLHNPPPQGALTSKHKAHPSFIPTRTCQSCFGLYKSPLLYALLQVPPSNLFPGGSCPLDLARILPRGELTVSRAGLLPPSHLHPAGLSSPWALAPFPVQGQC